MMDIADRPPNLSDLAVRFGSCMDAPSDITQTASTIGAVDVMSDDASHASHHQNSTFPELFPYLAPGGLCVIADLRWQPKTFERPGTTRTASLFRGFSKRTDFRHSDPATQAAFQELAPEISGCFLFQVQYTKTRRDQVAVIHKR